MTKSIGNINFFKNNDIEIQKIDLGHSGAFTYYVVMNDEEYFLKIIKGFDLTRIKEVYNSYLENNINVSKLFECGKFDDDYSYFIYESLGRDTLKSKLEKMTLEEIYNIGVFIGKENQKLSKNHENKLDSKKLSLDYIETINNYYFEFLNLLEKNNKFFTDDELKILTDIKLKKVLNDLFKLIKSEEVIYCHNDIKTTNIMFKDDVLYFIDIENTCENFFYRTLGANIFTIFPKTNEKYAEFYNGVLAGFYDFDIPKKAKDYLVLNYLSQMLKRINHCLTKKNNIDNYISDTKEFAKLLYQSNYFKDFDFSFLKTNRKYELLDIEIKRISTELYDKYKYELVKKIEGGYSGAISLLVKDKDKKCFCKVYNYDVDYDYIKNCLDIYDKLNINSLKILNYDSLFEGEYCFAVYNYLEGICLNNYIKEKNLTMDEVISYGVKVGEISRKLKEYKHYDENNFSKISITKETKSIIDELKLILKDPSKKVVINKYINDNELNILINNFNEYTNSFKEEEINLIHQDLKPANIMIDNDKLYIIDVESMALSYNVFDFKCTITWDLVGSYETEINYLKGYFNGLYNYEIPEILVNQLKYIFLYDFFRSLTGLFKDNNINLTKIDNYIKGVLDLIYNKDLDNVFNYVCENDYVKKKRIKQ